VCGHDFAAKDIIPKLYYGPRHNIINPIIGGYCRKISTA